MFFPGRKDSFDTKLTGGSVSQLFNKMNTFACTQYIEEGCLALQQREEYRTDRDLYHVIRLQRIIENIETLASVSGSDAEAQSAFFRVRQELEGFRPILVAAQDATDSRKLHPSYMHTVAK